jgi:hypothetical protein
MTRKARTRPRRSRAQFGESTLRIARGTSVEQAVDAEDPAPAERIKLAHRSNAGVTSPCGDSVVDASPWRWRQPESPRRSSSWPSARRSLCCAHEQLELFARGGRRGAPRRQGRRRTASARAQPSCVMAGAISLIQVPYHAGDDRHGASVGPARLVEAGAADLLRGRGLAVTVECIDRRAPSKDRPTTSPGTSSPPC